jgi:hypothetical protein
LLGCDVMMMVCDEVQNGMRSPVLRTEEHCFGVFCLP